jgi:hypothetical protein
MHKLGRELIISDNSPAQWAFSQAYTGKMPDLSEIRQMLANDVIPFSYVTKAAEKTQMKYRCTLAGCDNVNKSGWKLCHIEAVGLSTRVPPADVPLEKLLEHFRMLMSPSNHFLVPLRWAGLGEVPEFIQAIRLVEQKLPT